MSLPIYKQLSFDEQNQKPANNFVHLAKNNVALAFTKQTKALLIGHVWCLVTLFC